MAIGNLQDILNPDLTKDERVLIVKGWFESFASTEFNKVDQSSFTRTPAPAKSLTETYGLVKDVIDNYYSLNTIPADQQVFYAEDFPDQPAQSVIVTFSLDKRIPGAWGKGAPMQNKVSNQKPIFREMVKDPARPGYLQMITGYFYDNEVCFTIWARTNKAANKYADWFEDLMEENAWWLKASGVNRFIYMGRKSDVYMEHNDNRWYGRPIKFFIKTEKIRVYDMKTFEELIVKLHASYYK